MYLYIYIYIYIAMIVCMVWMMTAAESGKLPSACHLPGMTLNASRSAVAGEAFAGEWRASFAAWTGDLKEEVRIHKLPRNYGTNFLCRDCFGHKTLTDGNPYCFAGPSAMFMHTGEDPRWGAGAPFQ